MRQSVRICWAVLLALVLSCGTALAAAKKAAGPETLLDKAVAKEAKLKGYKYFFDYFEIPEGKEKGTDARYEFWKVKPNLIKLVVVEGENKSVKLSYRGDAEPDKVAVRRGRLPLPSMSKDDKRIEGFFRSGWDNDLKDIRQMTKGGTFKAAGTEKVDGAAADKVEVTTAKGAKFSRIVLWFEKKNGLLVQYEYYKGTVLTQKKTWVDVELDPKLTSEDFKL